jgi:hypothetical protein
MRCVPLALWLSLAFALVGCGGGPNASTSFDPYFVTEWGPTAYNTAPPAANDDDAGPATLVMVVAARGVITAPSSSTAEAAILSMRNLAHGGPTPTAEPTTTAMLLVALGASKLTADNMYLTGAASSIEQDIAQINGVINDRCYVHVAGDPGNAWGRSLDAAGHYLHHYTSASDTFTHWITIFGRDATGAYLVGDPLAEKGVFVASAAQLETYLSDGGTASAGINVFPLGE